MKATNSTPLWLFSGPETGERTTAIEAVKKSAEKTHGSLDSHVFYASETPLASVIDILQNGSLFAETRFVLIKNAEAIKKKEDITLLQKWAAEAEGTDSAFLVLVSDEISIDKKIEALVPKNQKKIFWELFENKKQDWIRRFFSHEHIKITQDGIASLLELVQNNTEALKTACTHISLFADKAKPLDGETIEALLAHNKEETAFSLFDALSKNNFQQALSIKQKLMLSKETSPVQIIAGLTYCFRRLRDWHNITKNGMSDDSTLRKNGFTSKKAINQYRNAASLWSLSHAHRIIALLNETDMSIRSTGQEMHDLLIEMCLYTIACKGGQPLEPYPMYDR